MQSGKYPTRELIFAVVANETVGSSRKGLACPQILERARRHYPELTDNTTRTILNRLVADEWLSKEGYSYSIHATQLHTVWLERLRWLEFLEGAPKQFIVEQINNL